MDSIRTYEGTIYLCSSCGQPCHEGPTEVGIMLLHFNEQWDGVYCPRFPLAESAITVEWHPSSLQTLKKQYPDTRSSTGNRVA